MRPFHEQFVKLILCNVLYKFCIFAEGNPGRCPPSDPNAITICLVECGDDNGCPGNQLCCTNGCRASCTNPVGRKLNIDNKKINYMMIYSKICYLKEGI